MTKKLLVILVFLLSPLFMMATDYYSVTADILNVRNQPKIIGRILEWLTPRLLITLSFAVAINMDNIHDVFLLEQI